MVIMMLEAPHLGVQHVRILPTLGISFLAQILRHGVMEFGHSEA